MKMNDKLYATQEYTLRAMASNYGTSGHMWDKLDQEICIKAADEIKRLRALIAEITTLLDKAKKL